MIKQIIKKNELIYELYQNIKIKKIIRLREKDEFRFKNMSERELLDYDAKLYFERQNRELKWSDLKSYTEKMQWAKIYDSDPRKTLLSDKYLVRSWVSEKIGDRYLIPLIGVWDSMNEVPFKELPDKFVIKTNHGSSDAYIVKDKKKLSLAERLRLRRIINASMHTDYSCLFCEMHYSSIEPKIIVEKLLETDCGELYDYKFLCFNGVPYYCWVDVDRYTNHKRNVYDMNWELQNWNQYTYGNSDRPISKPRNFEKMIEIVKVLSEGFSHVRVDLYNLDGEIYFGEMTFTNGSGFEPIIPYEQDLYLGSLWSISPKIEE